jgi:hypothetical protein
MEPIVAEAVAETQDQKTADWPSLMTDPLLVAVPKGCREKAVNARRILNCICSRPA